MYPQTLARPYAHAAFDMAQQGQTQAAWNDFLHLGAQLVDLPVVAGFVSDPRIPALEKATALLLCFSKSGFAWGKDMPLQERFVLELANANRLSLLPQMATLFNLSWSQAKGEFVVDIESAFAMSADTILTLLPSLEKTFALKLTATSRTNAALIGGFRATVGNRVLDCSLQTLLDKAKVQLSQ